MNKKICLLALLMLFFGLLSNLRGAVFTVGASGQDFTSIQAANDDAGVADGDTLYIMDPVITEGNIAISKDLMIIGTGMEGSVIEAAPDSGTASNRVMHITPGADVALMSLTIRHGVDTAGGGILNEGTLMMHDCVVEKNVATNWQPPSGGGGIFSDSPFLQLSSTDFYRNYCYGHGGGINNSNTHSIVNIDNCQFIENITEGGGGGMHSPFDSVINITNSGFTDNVAMYAKGGGLNIGGGTTDDMVYIGNCSFVGNTSEYPGGGLNIYCDSAMLENLLVRDNLSHGSGGGVSIMGTWVMLVSSSIIGNEAWHNGGGITITHRAEGVYIANTTISGNYAHLQGGGIRNKGNLALDFSTVVNNTAAGVGAGIVHHIDIDNEMIMKNSVIAENYDSTLTHPNLSGDFMGANIYSAGFNLIGNLGNFEFVNNNEGDIFGDTADMTTPHAEATKLIEIIDPMLSGLIEGPLPYHMPQSGSPLLDAADDLTFMDVPPGNDMRGVSRPYNEGNDIGAVERDIADDIEVTATVSNVARTGFALTLVPPVDGLDASNFSLDNGGIITDAITPDGGNTYFITTDPILPLTLYTLTIEETGYNFTVVGDDIIVTTVGNAETMLSGKLSVYPNPAHENIYIYGLSTDTDAIVTIEIIDVTGSLAKSVDTRIEQTIKVNISDLNKGLYFIKIDFENSIYSGKLFVK